MLADRILAVVSIALFVGFMGIVAYFVREPELWVIFVVVALLAIYDFWNDLRPGGSGPKPL